MSSPSQQVPILSLNEFLLGCMETFPAACGVMGRVGDEDALRIRTKLLALMSKATTLQKWVDSEEKQEAPVQSSAPEPQSKPQPQQVEEYSGKHATHNAAGAKNGRLKEHQHIHHIRKSAVSVVGDVLGLALQSAGDHHHGVRKDNHADWEGSVQSSKDHIDTKHALRDQNIQELRHMKTLVSQDQMRQDTLHQMCAQFHISLDDLDKLEPHDLFPLAPIDKRPFVPRKKSGEKRHSGSPSPSPMLKSTPAPSPLQKATEKSSAVSPMQHLDLGGGRKQSTMVHTGESPLGMHLVPSAKGNGVMVEGITDDSFADASNVGQALISVNGIDVSNMPLVEILKTLQKHKPATLVFAHPEADGTQSNETIVSWNGDSPLGMHLETANDGAVVKVGAVNDDSEHADQSHVGQHLVAINGVDTTAMPLGEVIKLLRTTAKPIHLTFVSLDLQEQVEEQRILEEATAGNGPGGAQAGPGPGQTEALSVVWPADMQLGLNLTQCGVGSSHDRSAMVENVVDSSPLIGKVHAGHSLVSVNGTNVTEFPFVDVMNALMTATRPATLVFRMLSEVEQLRIRKAMEQAKIEAALAAKQAAEQEQVQAQQPTEPPPPAAENDGETFWY